MRREPNGSFSRDWELQLQLPAANMAQCPSSETASGLPRNTWKPSPHSMPTSDHIRLGYPASGSMDNDEASVSGADWSPINICIPHLPCHGPPTLSGFWVLIPKLGSFPAYPQFFIWRKNRHESAITDMGRDSGISRADLVLG